LTITSSDDPTEDNTLAYAAITLCANPLQGAPPQWQELVAWRNGTLDNTRSAEVLSHVANNPACFQQWLDVAEAQSWVAEESRLAIEADAAEPIGTSERKTFASSPYSTSNAPGVTSGPARFIQALRSFFQQPLPVYGGAFAAVIVAVLVAPLLRTGDGLSLQQQLDRSTDAFISEGAGFAGSPPAGRNTRSLAGLFDELSINDVERLHVLTGQQHFLDKLQLASGAPVADAWQDWFAELPSEGADCAAATDSTHCLDVADELQMLGQWSLMNAAACSLRDMNIPASDFWSEQYEIYDTIRALPGVMQSQEFAAVLPALDPRTQDALCAIANAVIAASR